MAINIPRPNDVWLRIWLILVWIIMCWLNAEYAWKWTVNTFGKDSVWAWFQPIIYSLALTIIMLILWNKFKRPDCKCWDDINPDCNCPDHSPHTKVTKLTGKLEGQERGDYP